MCATGSDFGKEKLTLLLPGPTYFSKGCHLARERTRVHRGGRVSLTTHDTARSWHTFMEASRAAHGTLHRV
jgi:hypothetical protein